MRSLYDTRAWHGAKRSNWMKKGFIAISLGVLLVAPVPSRNYGPLVLKAVEYGLDEIFKVIGRVKNIGFFLRPDVHSL